MKEVIYIIVIIFLSSCKGGLNNENQKKEPVFVGNGNFNHKYDLPKSIKEKTIVGVIDSLNSQNYKIPNLLNNVYLDYEFNSMYIYYDKATSTRKFIINRVINIQALKAILASDNKNLSIKPSQEFIKKQYNDFILQMPYIQYSLKELASKRLEELSE
ncbi:hypothetical protein AAEO56_18580 [Flavobacterium sp. DGU11]|uniref:DUF4296 domain-containing protein n=1 Tax=Flavobacterium arundinis TaxID=3139143 RepID=A0ABU9I1I3_9FLAO